MVTIVKGKIIDQFTQKWKMDGKSGTTERISVYVGQGKVENVAVTDETAPYYAEKVGDSVELECDCFIRSNGSYNLKACTE